MPGAVAPHPQRNEPMYQALKSYIMRGRQKKKEEQEADEKNERQRKRELQEKQDARQTLSENREQIIQLEQKIAQLKDEKHNLFVQLKKVLNEDDRRKQMNAASREQENRSNSEVNESYATTSSSSHLLMQLEYPSSSYKIPSVQGVKRARSPSPNSHLYQMYNHKANRLPYQKSYTNYYPNPGSSQAYYPGPYTALPMRTDSQPPPIKQHYSGQPYMHGSEHPKLYAEDKYYSVPSRPTTHVALHGGSIPIQPPQTKTGGITSGYPIRQPASAPPPQHVTPGISTSHSSSGYPYPLVSQYPPSRPTLASSQHLGPRSHAGYPSQSPTTGRLVYSQGNVPQSRYM